MAFQPIKSLCFPTIAVLPTVFDDSLSYMEILSKVTDKVNEVITTVNSFEEDLINTAMQYTDSQISQLKTYVQQEDTNIRRELAALQAQLEADMQDVLDQVDAKNLELRNFVQSEINRIQQAFVDYQKYINASLASVYSYVDGLNAQMKDYVDEEIAEVRAEIQDIQIDQSILLNPVTNRYAKTQKVVDDMFYNLQCWGLRAIDYQRLGYTAEEYQKLGMTAWNYDYMAKWWMQEKPDLLRRIDELKYMYNPFSGMKDTVVDVIYQIIGQIRTGGLTALEYQQLELTAEEYQAKGLTAYEYAWNGKELLAV